MFETVLITLLLLAGAFALGRFTGRRAGVEQENLRVQQIFRDTLLATCFRGHIEAIWDRVEGKASREEMLERLRGWRQLREGEATVVLEKQRRDLWMLLDHIDTLDDSCRDDDAAFRRFARKHQQHRFAIWNPESDDEVATFQQRVDDWVHAVLGADSACNIQERALRCAEEAIELAQVCEVAPERLHKLVDYVFGREVGEAAQEIAGCLVTLYAMANALDVDAEKALEVELLRIQRPEVKERVRRRQNEKRAVLLAEHGAH